MSQSPSARAKELFLAAIDRPADERTAFVAAECGDDGALRERVERLLAAHQRAEKSAILDLGAGTPLSTSMAHGVPLPVVPDPARVGSFRIVQRLGEGGMGVVYLAEQEHPIRRMVALKLVKAGMDSRQVLARFESERQALARMTHPNIARILDAGTSEDGRPFFVMEYVPGEPLTTFCDSRRLSLEERLGLFGQVCDAVQHAHQKGVIHRDLKPSNVLVSELDRRPTPKIIDFGIAKAVEQQDVEASFQTVFGQMVGTPDYMSPEQADPLASDVDTRADVYGLGVVLYQLMCGALPFDFGGSGKSLKEIQKTIRGTEAPAPSARLAAMAAGDAAVIAAERRTSVAQLGRALRNDLDWIALRALEKERERRYPSAAELAAELERHLAGEPVLAGPPTAAYRVCKFVRRHRVGVGLAAASVVALLGFAVTMAAKNRIIADERDRANEATERALAEAETARRVTRLLTGLFEVASPEIARGHEPTARDIIERGVRRVRAELDDQPEVKARLLATLGVVYRGIGRYQESRDLLDDALELLSATLGDDHVAALAVRRDLALTLARLGERDAARRLLEALLEVAPRVYGAETAQTFAIEENLIELDIEDARNDEAIAHGRDLVERERRFLGGDERQTLSTEGLLALAELNAGHNEAAAERYEELLPRQAAVFGIDHPTRLAAMHNLTRAYIELGRLDDASALCSEALALRRRVFGPDHPETLATLNTLAIIHLRDGRLDDAERVLEEVIEAWRRQFGDEHPARLSAMMNLVEVCARQGDFERALALAREARDAAPRAFGADHPRTLTARQTLGFVLYESGQDAEAILELAPLIEDQRQVLGPADPRTLDTADILASAYVRLGRFADSEQVRAGSAAALANARGPGAGIAAMNSVAAAMCAATDHRPDDAIAHLRRAVTTGARVPAFATNPAFATLRDDPEFVDLVQQLEQGR